jgi:hypothetical protein
VLLLNYDEYFQFETLFETDFSLAIHNPIQS